MPSTTTPATTANNSNFSQVRIITIDADSAGQRIDNFVFKYLQDIPRSHVYKLLRTGQIRIDGKRKKPTYKLNAGETLRIAPVKIATSSSAPVIGSNIYRDLCQRIIFENEIFIAFDKPAGLAVHAGSNVEYGLIEIIKAHHPTALELVHRLDRDTSGVLLLAKGRQNLLQLQQLFATRNIEKTYTALLSGQFSGKQLLSHQLLRYRQGDEFRVRIGSTAESGSKLARSEFCALENFANPAQIGGSSLCAIKIFSGRTHQIRVQAQALGRSLAGDSKYNDRATNKLFAAYQLTRLFLHASSLSFSLGEQHYKISAALPAELTQVLANLRLSGSLTSAQK